MKRIEQNPITHVSRGRSGDLRGRLHHRISRVCRFTRRGAAPLGLAAGITLALVACDAVNRRQAARDKRSRAGAGLVQSSVEGASGRQQQDAGATPAARRETPPSPYADPFHRDTRRGFKTVGFSVPGPRPDEICVIPRHLPFGDYRGNRGAKDRADERKLASYDFYKAGSAESGAVGISPKRTRTSAALEVYQLPAGTSRPQHLNASACRSFEKNGKKVAKFKQTDNKYTTTCTASILGYYHASRALGDICEIKPAVLRTMDIPQHKKVVRLASAMGARGIVAKSWRLFDRYYANPRGTGMARALFTSDFTQIYGALLENTRGEKAYTEWLRAGTDLTTTTAFRHMADGRPASSVIGSRSFTRQNVQALVAMRDMSELILMDYLFAQSDRLSGGNISYYDYAYDLIEGAGVNSSKASKAGSLVSGASRVIVKKLTIKDTDGGLLNTNTFERKGYLPRIRHMHPDTYEALQKFAAEWQRDPAVKEFFRVECTFSSGQLARFEKYLFTAAGTLRQRMENGTLHLDLDLDDYYRGVRPNAVPQIAGAVGSWNRGAANRPIDVEGVQRLLTRAAEIHGVPALDPRGVDGLIARPPRSSSTVASIEAFELHFDLPEQGVIEPGGPAWQELLRAAGAKQSEGRRNADRFTVKAPRPAGREG